MQQAMSHPVHDARPASGSGPWRVLLLDREPGDPKWCIATVTPVTDAKPAVLDAAGRYLD